MENYHSQYSDLIYESEFTLLTTNWKKTSQSMDDETFRKEHIKKVEFIRFYKPLIHLIDFRKFLYIINPENQAWISNNVFEEYAKNGLQRIAFVMSEDYIAQLSIQQSVDEDKTDAFQSNYFSDLEEARAWLLEKVS